MRSLPLYLYLVLASCQGSTSVPADAGFENSDGHMLRFDVGADSDAEIPAPDRPADIGDAATDVAVADRPADDATTDVQSLTDAVQTDYWSWQEDAFHPSTDAGVCTGQMPCYCELDACSYDVECLACRTAQVMGRPLPAYCSANLLWNAFMACYHI